MKGYIVKFGNNDLKTSCMFKVFKSKFNALRLLRQMKRYFKNCILEETLIGFCPHCHGFDEIKTLEQLGICLSCDHLKADIYDHEEE